jgi:hypothetical protein
MAAQDLGRVGEDLPDLNEHGDDRLEDLWVVGCLCVGSQ